MDQETQRTSFEDIAEIIRAIARNTEIPSLGVAFNTHNDLANRLMESTYEPKPGTLVYEWSTSAPWRGVPALESVGILISEGDEPLQLEEGEVWDEEECGYPLPNEMASWLQTLDGRRVRWTNCDFHAIQSDLTITNEHWEQKIQFDPTSIPEQAVTLDILATSVRNATILSERIVTLVGNQNKRQYEYYEPLISYIQHPVIGDVVTEVSTLESIPSIHAVGTLLDLATAPCDIDGEYEGANGDARVQYIRTFEGKVIKWSSAQFLAAPTLDNDEIRRRHFDWRLEMKKAFIGPRKQPKVYSIDNNRLIPHLLPGFTELGIEVASDVILETLGDAFFRKAEKRVVDLFDPFEGETPYILKGSKVDLIRDSIRNQFEGKNASDETKAEFLAFYDQIVSDELSSAPDFRELFMIAEREIKENFDERFRDMIFRDELTITALNDLRREQVDFALRPFIRDLMQA